MTVRRAEITKPPKIYKYFFLMLVFHTKWIFDLRIILKYKEILKNKYYLIATFKTLYNHLFFFKFFFLTGKKGQEIYVFQKKPLIIKVYYY